MSNGQGGPHLGPFVDGHIVELGSIPSIYSHQTGKPETCKVMEEYHKKLIDEFRKVLGVIEGDRWWPTGHGQPRDPEEIDWNIYRLILRNYVNSVLRKKVLGPVFNHIANTFVDSFVKRAGQVYRAGQGSGA